MRHFFLKKLPSFIFLSTLCLVTVPSNADGDMIILNDKPISSQPMNIRTCGELNGPEHAAARFALNFAQANGENTWLAACKAGIQTKCSSEDIKRFGIQMVFDLMRKYESGLSNAACKQVRKECEDRCLTTKFFDERACIIECNQYEARKR